MKLHKVVRFSKLLRSILFSIAVGVWFGLTAMAANAAADSAACGATSETRQLDFWIGDWTVTFPGMSSTAMSKVSLSLDKCLFVENWDGGKGHSGENMFAYSSDDKGWHGMFADNQGRVHVFEGKVTAGAAEFFGPSRGSNGEAVLNKIRIVRVTKDKVEQSWEKSADNGLTWTLEFRGEYSRRNP